MNLKHIALLSLLVAMVGAPDARADSCTYSLGWRSDITSADRSIMVNACASGWLPHWWSEHGFANEASYWDEGFGSDNSCNPDKPLGRTMNALYLLKFSFSPPNAWGDLSGNVIQWGYPYAGEQFVEANAMKAYCGDFSNGMPIKYASTHDSWPEDHFEWYMGFFYLENPVERAMSLFHESIHRGTGRGHDCQDGGADTSWAFHGAYYYGVEWLISYYLHANTNTNSTYKTWAAQTANWRIARKFCADDVPSSVKNWAGASAGSSFNGTVMNL
jgi:hypothetical protein